MGCSPQGRTDMDTAEATEHARRDFPASAQSAILTKMPHLLVPFYPVLGITVRI